MSRYGDMPNEILARARAALVLIDTGARPGPTMIAALDVAVDVMFENPTRGIVTWNRLGPVPQRQVARWLATGRR